MKYELDTIPVWEAYEAEGECPLCYLSHKLERQNIKFFLGGSVMQPHIRELVNKYGFCPPHFLALYKEGEKLPVTIMAHSHYLELMKLGKKKEKQLMASFKRSSLPTRGGAAFEEKLDQYIHFLKDQTGECALCRKTRHSLERYTYTIIELWRKKEEFKKIYEASRGFCFTHLPEVMTMARQRLSGTTLELFFKELLEKQEKNSSRILEEAEWFISKFDHLNKDAPWKTSRDAPTRIIQRLSGIIPEKL